MKYFCTLGALLAAVLVFPPSSFSLTAEEVMKLKEAGVSEETIQLMIQQETNTNEESDPAKKMGVKKVTEPDGNSATVYSTGESKHRDDYEEESEREKRDKAWRMLENVVIDTRDVRRPPGPRR